MSRFAKEGDPYVAPNGKVLAPINSDSGKSDEIDITRISATTPNVNTMTISARRNPNEMPTPDANMQKAINVILMYQLLGLNDNEIAHLLGIDMDQVRDIKQMGAYQDTFEAVFSELISVNSSSLQARLSRHAHTAMNTVVSLTEKADKDMVRLKASQDILDRSGLDPDFLFGKPSDSQVDGFKIIIEDANDRPSGTKVDISFNSRRR